MTGTIGVAAQDAARFTEFSLSMGRLHVPEGWEIYGALNYDLAHARNFLAGNFAGDRLWFMDDDHSFAPDTLERLLAHDADIVGPLCLGRRSPFPACPRIDGKPLPLREKPGLVEVDETGGAGLLVHRRVFDALEHPWFQHGTTPDGGHISDDQYFTRKAKAAGFKIFVDTSVAMPHWTVVQVAPHYDDGWSKTLTVGGLTVTLPENLS